MTTAVVAVETEVTVEGAREEPMRKEIDTELLAVAAQAMESAQAFDDPRRVMRERLAARFFMQACGLAPAPLRTGFRDDRGLTGRQARPGRRHLPQEGT